MDRCWAFCRAYNERDLIGYWVRHFRTFCERVTVYVDADTDDGTEVVAQREGAVTRRHDSGGALDDVAFVAFAQEAYKEARGRAAWVVWVDADELVHHPRMAERLDELRAKGVTYPHVEGYTMLADAPPTHAGQLYAHPAYRRGLAAHEYAKPCLFDPALDVAWSPGKHGADVSGNAVRDDGNDAPKLLHYRWLGEDWFVARNARNYARIPEAQRRAQLGREVYPGYEGVYSPAWYRAQMPNVREVLE